MMTGADLQRWLGAHGQPVAVDGDPGPQTRAAIIAAFTNPCAAPVTNADIVVLASRLGCSPQQLRAVASVESAGSAFKDSRPKILFERHLFDRFTKGVHSVTPWSNPKGGGYGENSWDKLVRAACVAADAAFMATSWGKFQVLGMHADALGYTSPIDMAYSTVTGEAAHYEMFARYVEKNNLVAALRAISTNPATCRKFAKAYNGADYEQFDYHNKLARAMQ